MRAVVLLLTDVQHYGPTTEHLLGILSGLLQHLPADSAGRIRTLAKFVEKDYEKTKRILELRQEYASRLKVVDAEIDEQRAALTAESQTKMEDEWLSRRLDAGLFCAQVSTAFPFASSPPISKVS
jgi:beta-catenin-like protein 1